MSVSKHYGDVDGLRLLSCNAIVNFVNTNRNFGKTWAFKKRAFRRAVKKGKKTLWIRMFKKECKEACASFYSSVDLLKYCGASIYDKKTNPNGNLKREGYSFFAKRKNGKWVQFLKIVNLGNPDAVRSADDVDVDTIVFDEYTKTAERYRRYRGNIVNDFLDIWFSAKREHEVRCILLGNKESIYNPFFANFGITAPKADWEGIRLFRKGSIAVQQLNNEPSIQSEFELKTKALLAGTSYGSYIYGSEYKTAMPFKARKTPQGALLYIQLSILSSELKISVLDGFYYVSKGIDRTKAVYCLGGMPQKYKKERALLNRNKPLFYAFTNAYSLNRVCYDSQATREAIEPFLKWLSLR